MIAVKEVYNQKAHKENKQKNVICITDRYVFPCQQWLSTSKGDGQIARELVPYDPSRKKSVADSMLEDRG